MKLKIKEFRTIAKRKGYGNEKILYIALGGGDYGINAIKAGCRVGYEIVREKRIRKEEKEENKNV